MAAIPCIEIDLSSLDPRRRRDRWQDLMSTHDIGPFEEQAPPLPATITSWHLGQIALGPARANDMRLNRSRNHIRRDQIDHYAIGVSTGGRWTGDARDRGLDAVGDSVFVLDMAQDMSVRVQQMRTVQVVIPRDLLEAAVPARNLHGKVLRGGAAGLLHDHILALVRRLPELTTDDAPGVVRATIAMIAAAIGPTPDNLVAASPALDRMILTRARRYIEARLGDPALDPDAICAALRVSRSRLYELFEPFNGVAAYIQRRRLARVHAILAEGADSRLIFTIAQSYGFTNAAHFSRAFRAAFGYAPRDVRRAGSAAGPMPGAGAAEPHPDDNFLAWLRTLSA